MLIFLSEIFLGFLIFDYFDSSKKLTALERLFSSAFVGFLISNFLILVFSLISRSLNTGIAIYALLFIFLLLLFKNKAISLLKEKREFEWGLLLVLLLYSAYISIILFYGPDNSLRSAIMGWGDNALHISLIEKFSNVEPFNLKHPLLAGSNLNYPFLMDFSSGVFHKLGLDIVTSYRIPLLFSGMCAISLLFLFCLRILKSRSLAFVAILLIFLGSGTGIATYANDLKNSVATNGLKGITLSITNPAHEYTHLDNATGGKPSSKDTNDNIVWIVPLVSFFGHQRSFSLGLAIFSIILLAITTYKDGKDFWKWGILAGLLPFSHAHTLLALFFLMSVLFLYNLKKPWILFAITTAVIALPQLAFFNSGNMFRFNFGWMCGNSSVLLFWIKNFGMIFILWVIALILVKKNEYIWASIILFIIPNIVLFQPWAFDNNKLFFYWWLLAVIFCVIPLLKLIWKWKPVVVLIIILACGAGIIDFTSKFYLVQKESYGYSDKDNYEIGEWIKNNTSKDSLFITSKAVDPVPLFLAGRDIYLGYEGWLWSEGLNYWKNSDEAKEILKGNTKLACEKKVNYIFLDGALKDTYEVNENAFKEIYSKDNKKILEVICTNTL